MKINVSVTCKRFQTDLSSDDEDEGYFDPDEGAVLYHMICTSPKGARCVHLIGIGN